MTGYTMGGGGINSRPVWSPRMGSYATHPINFQFPNSFSPGRPSPGKVPNASAAYAARLRKQGSWPSHARHGIAAAGAITGISSGMKAIESLRYGELGGAAMHATMAAAGGLTAFHAFYRTPTFSNAASRTAAFVRKQGMGNGSAGSKAAIRNIANFVRNIG